MSWQKFSNVKPSLNEDLVIWMRGDPYYGKRFLHNGMDLVAICTAYCSIKSNDPQVLLKNTVPILLSEISRPDEDYQWGYFKKPE